MQVPAKPAKVIPAKPVLVPPVIHRRNPPGKNQQERRQRSQLVNPHPLLELHPLLDPRGVVTGPPPREVDDHHARVKVAGPAAREGPREGRVGPKRRRKVGREVSAAVFWGCEDCFGAERGGGELGNVVDEDQVGVEVDDHGDVLGEEVGEVGAGVVEGAVEGGADGGGDEAGGGAVVEGVDLEV